MPGEKLYDYYALLGVPATATDEEIRKAHRAKLLEVHPDTHPGEAAEEHAKRLGEARQVLLDPKARASYDAARTGSPDALDYLEAITGIRLESAVDAAIEYGRARVIEFIRDWRK